MAYFQHAYNKAFVVNSLESLADQKTLTLDSAQLGVVDAADYETILFPTTNTTVIPNEYLLVVGNYNPTDTLGNNPIAGGYAESLKTKVINKKYVREVWKQDCIVADTETVTIAIPDTCIKCDGSTTDGNQLRLDIKGEETLRFLNRFSYATFSYRECCTEGTDVPGATVATAWAAAINADPLMKHFVTATTSATNLILTLSYTATFFDNCSYDTRDYVGTAPLTLIVSAVNDGGDPCTDTCLIAKEGSTIVTDFGIHTATAVATKAETSGETVLEQVIMEGRYRQDGGWNQGNKDSARIRQIEGGDHMLTEVTRSAFYAGYHLLHSVPRFNNPTGVFDNDQYLYTYYVDCTKTTEITGMDFLWASIAAAAGEPLNDFRASR